MNYVEIGIREGESLRLALQETKCVGIDPQLDIQDTLPAYTRLLTMTSDEFFSGQDLPILLGSAP